MHAKPRSREVSVTVNYTMQAILEQCRTKIDQNPEGHFHQTQIGQKLFGMDRVQILNGFQFHDKLMFNKQIHAETFVKHDIPEVDRNRFLPLDNQPTLDQHASENSLIRGFQEPRPQISMQFQRRIDHGPRDLFDLSTRLRPFVCAIHDLNDSPLTFSPSQSPSPLRVNSPLPLRAFASSRELPYPLRAFASSRELSYPLRAFASSRELPYPLRAFASSRELSYPLRAFASSRELPYPLRAFASSRAISPPSPLYIFLLHHITLLLTFSFSLRQGQLSILHSREAKKNLSQCPP